jgi:hypothetical protein
MSFKFGAPSAPSVTSLSSGTGSSASGSQKSYSGSFISAVSPSDSVSNVGSMIHSMQLNPVNAVEVFAGAAGGAAGGPQINEGPGNVIYDDLYNRDWSRVRLGFADFLDWSKEPLTYAAGNVFKAAHNTIEIREIKSSFHMQYLHIIDINLNTPAMLHAPDSVKTQEIARLNKLIFDDHIKITTQWGTCSFYRNFKNLIAKPVIASVYNNDLDDTFFRSTKQGADQPLSKAAFQDWLARN